MTVWRDWNPGLNNGARTLGEVWQTLPGAPPQDINFLVRLIENPASPFALPGAVTLFNHDCIHILLGRGLLNQDEAFVIGFTMGTAKEELTKFHEYLFKQVATRLYPKPYRFSKRHLLSFDLGVREGKEWGHPQLYEFPFDRHQTDTLSTLRKRLGIDVKRLKGVYKEEQELLPGTRSSNRLTVS